MGHKMLSPKKLRESFLDVLAFWRFMVLYFFSCYIHILLTICEYIL